MSKTLHTRAVKVRNAWKNRFYGDLARMEHEERRSLRYMHQLGDPNKAGVVSLTSVLGTSTVTPA
jgi:hypothetical protein